MKVKHSHWFAAAVEVRRAIVLLSDGAFKLYMHLCLQANPKNGSLTASYVELAGMLVKSERSIATYFKELRGHNVCEVRPAANQHQRNIIEICDEFWPYPKSESQPESEEFEQYFVQIRWLLAPRACVKCAFNASDREFAATLLASDISLQQIERAIALGCSRKYLSLLKGNDRQLIVSFSYFRDVIYEAGDEKTSAVYLDHVKLSTLKRLETHWIQSGKIADANVAPAARRKKQSKTK